MSDAKPRKYNGELHGTKQHKERKRKEREKVGVGLGSKDAGDDAMMMLLLS